MKKDPYALERAEYKKNKGKMSDPMRKFYEMMLGDTKGEKGDKGDSITREQITSIKNEILKKIPTPKDGKDADYDLVFNYVVQEVERVVSEKVAKIPKPKDGKPGKDAVVDIPAIVESLLKVMPKMEVGEVDYLGIKDYIDKQVSKIKIAPPLMRNGGTNSLRQLTDVDLSGLSTDAQGNYILGGGGGTWGSISGTLSDQTDLQAELDAKEDTLVGATITGKATATAVGTDYVLISDTNDSGKLKKALISDFASAGGDMAAATYDPQAIGSDAFDVDNHTDGTTNKVYTATEQTKLAGIATGATANDTDANLKNRANHTGTQLASTISDFNSAALSAAPAETTTTLGALIGSAGAATPNDSDDIATALTTGGLLKRISWTNAKAFLKTYFDTIYQAAGTYYSAGGTDVPVTDGGTGASTAAGARTNLGLVIGTDVQAQDAELSAIAGLTSAADRLPYFTGSGTASLATFTSAGRALIDDASATAQRTTLGVGTADSPQFTAVNIGHATDTTVSRVSAGVIAVEGVTVPTISSTSTLTNKTLTDPKIHTTENAQTGTTYTLVLTDASKFVSMSNASANTLTVPPNSSVAFTIGTKVAIQQRGAGSTTIAAGAGVTINAPSTVTLAIGEQYESRVIIKTATDTWQLV